MVYESNKKTVAQNFSSLTKDALDKITKNLNSTLRLGLATGFIGIIGYTLSLHPAAWKFLFLFILLASASYISGFFLGFLFGIPKRNTDKESAYNLSTNLVDISDWLTKIIIGLGLVEIRRIPGYLQSVGEYIQQATHGEDSMKIFSVSCIVYFSIFGLYYGYNYMRLFLSGQFKEADDNLLQKQIRLTETGEVLNSQNLSPDNIDDSAKEKLKEYNQLLKSTKTEEDYTFDDWYYKGIAAYDTKDNNKTIAYMKNALENDPRSKNAPDAYLYIGLAYYNLKLFEKAIEANNKIVNNYKDYGFVYLAHFNNGTYYDELKQYTSALQEYETSIEQKPDYAESWNNKGDILIKLNRYDEAIPVLDQSIKINSLLPYPWYNKAHIFAIKKDKENMLANLKRAIELEPNYKTDSKTDTFFESFFNDEDFKKLVQ